MAPPEYFFGIEDMVKLFSAADYQKSGIMENVERYTRSVVGPLGGNKPFLLITWCFSYFKLSICAVSPHYILPTHPPRVLFVVMQVVCISIVCCLANSCDIKGSSVFQRLD